jgi:hypothetical protein
MPTKCDSRSALFTFTTPSGGQVVSSNLWLSNFSLVLGIGAASSTLDMELVVDPCAGQGAGQIAEVGTPVLFNVYANQGSSTPGLSFGGILTSATESLSSNGLRYKVQVIDPRKMLEYVSVLLKGYYCPVPSLDNYNFMNVCAWMHKDVALCPPGEDTHNWPRVNNCNNWGRSSGDNQVYLVDALRAIQQYNTGIVTTNGQYRLSLNFQLLINTLLFRAPYARTSNSESNLLNLISEACDACGCDFYVTLQRYTIFINLIDRTIIPTNDNPIKDIISAGFSSGICTKGERGFEEIYANSNKFVIGEQVHYLANVVTETKARMMLGYDLTGFPIQVDGINFTVPINTSPIAAIINGFPPMFTISEEEILFTGSSEMWKLYGIICNENNKQSLSGTLINLLGLGQVNLRRVLDAFNALQGFANNGNVNGFARAMDDISGISTAFSAAVNVVLYERAYAWFQQFIKTWYGRYWLVPVNTICAHAPYGLYGGMASDNTSVSLSDVPVEAGYGTPANRMGLIDPSLFITQDGKVNGFGMISAAGSRKRRIGAFDIDFIISKDFSDNNYVYQPTNNMIYGSLTTTGQVYNNPQTNTNDVVIQTPFLGLTVNADNRIKTQGLRALAAMLGMAQNVTDFISNHQQGIKGATRKTAINIFKLENAAAMYYAVNIPMKSNIYVYGPWVGSQGQIGSTEIVKTDLSPWAYGDYAGMNTVGTALSNAGLRFTNKTESGSVTLAEPPAYSIGVFRNTIATIKSINVNYNEGGVTSDYSFQVYSAKFGQYAKALSDEVQKANKERNRILDIIRTQRKNSLIMVAETRKAIAQRLKDLGIQEILSRVASPNVSASPSSLLIGGYYDAILEEEDNGGGGGEENNEPTPTPTPTPNNECTPSIAINLDGICDSSFDQCEEEQQPEEEEEEDTSEEDSSSSTTRKNYEMGLNTLKEVESAVTGDAVYNMALMSLDGLISPVSIKGRKYRLSPYFQSWDQDDENSSTNKKNSGSKGLPINQKYLNPILSKKLLEEWDSRGESDSTNILMLSFGEDIADIKSSHDPDRYDDHDDFGFCALRGPLVLQAWGYDTDGKPIPNSTDIQIDTEKGIFNNSGLADKFMDNWLANPRTWPVAPIDLRFDRKRGVWVAGGDSNKIVIAQLTERIDPMCSGEAKLAGSGCNFINVKDYLGKTYYKGSKIYAKLHENNEYIIMEHVSSAPLLVTGTADNDFTSNTASGISVNVDHSMSSECILGSTLINDVRNPLGYGAAAGDLVTMYLICDSSLGGDESASDCPGGTYMIIGTGSPPLFSTTEECLDDGGPP